MADGVGGAEAAAAAAPDVEHMLADPEDIVACSFSSWYPAFAKVTIPSRIIELPSSFVEYLQDDGPLVLPDGANPTNESFRDENSDDSDSEQWASRPDDPAAAAAPPPPSFPELEAKIQKAIDRLGGTVFPKLNWSSPRDVPWIMTTGTLKCTTPGDVFLLLKASDFVTHDLTAPFACCVAEPPSPIKYELVLRRWTDVATGAEFRCFVRGNRLVGVSQRDHTNFYPAVVRDAAAIKRDVVDFYNDKILGHFPRENFVFDVYRRGEGSVLLLDFNPLCPVTDELLFEWPELLPRESENGAASDAAPAAGAAAGGGDDKDDGAVATSSGAATAGADAATVEEAAKPTLTDKLNKSLLMSFLNRINDPASDVPTYESVDEAWPADDGDTDDDGDRDAAIRGLLAAMEQSRHDATGAAAAGAAAPPPPGAVGAAGAGRAAPAAADVDIVDFRYVASAEQARMRPSVFIDSRVPKDVIQISNAEDIQRLATLYRRRQLRQDDESSDSDGDGDGG